MADYLTRIIHHGDTENTEKAKDMENRTAKRGSNHRDGAQGVG